MSMILSVCHFGFACTSLLVPMVIKKTLLKLYIHIDERSKKNIHPNCLLHRKFPGEKYQAHSLSTWALRFVPSSPSIKLSTPSVPSAVAFFTGPQMDVSENSGTPKSSILIGFSIIFTIHFGVPLFLETPR